MSACIVKNFNLSNTIFEELHPVIMPTSTNANLRIRHAIYSDDFKSFEKILRSPDLKFSKKYQDGLSWIEHIIYKKRNDFLDKLINFCTEKDIFIAQYFRPEFFFKHVEISTPTYGLLYIEIVKYSFHRLSQFLKKDAKKYKKIIDDLTLSIKNIKEGDFSNINAVIQKILFIRAGLVKNKSLFFDNSLLNLINSEMRYLNITSGDQLPDFKLYERNSIPKTQELPVQNLLG